MGGWNRGHGRSGTPEYKAWNAMRGRCRNPKNPAYPNYGGRGIGVCEPWAESFEAFLADMGERPGPGYDLDRRDNDRGYEPGNCRWVPRKVNLRNQRTNRRITFRGRTRTLAGWCEEVGLPYDTVRKRLNAGWSTEQALTKPLRKQRSPRTCPELRARDEAAA